MACRVVCISHATGAGGDDVGRLVAQRLGFLYVNEEIIAATALRGGLDPGEVADEERRKSLASRILNALAETGAEGAALGLAGPIARPGDPTSSDIRALIRETIVQTASRGRIVISSHAASYALDQRADILRVLVTASRATRMRRLSKEEGVDDAKASSVLSDADAGRRDYLKRFYDVSQELPTHYDLVINTDVLSLEDAADVVAHAAGRSG